MPMNLLHRYIFRQTLATLLVTVMVFVLVLLLGSVVKELTSRLVQASAGLGVLFRAILLLLPYLLVYALPIGMLCATLLVFGRLSADQELTAMRASGIGLVSLIWPVVLLGLVLSAFCAVVTLDFGPRARHAYKQLIVNMGLANLDMVFPERTIIESIPGYTVYLGKHADGQLEDITIWYQSEGRVDRVLTAREGSLSLSEDRRELQLTVRDGFYVEEEFGEELPPIAFGEISETFQVDAFEQRTVEASDSNMSLRELLDKRARLRDQGVDATPVQVQIHSKVAFSFACIGFTLVGIPLGIQGHRRETSIGIFAAVILMGVYYGGLVLGQSLETQPEWHPELLVWLPNLLFQIVGAFLIWRAHRAVR